MHVLHILPRLDIGGIQQAVLTLLTKAVTQFPDIQHTVVAAPGPLRFSLPEEVTYVPLNLHRQNPVSLLTNGIRLARLVTTQNINLMHAQSRGPCWSTLIASALISVPWVSSVHGAHKVQNALKRFYNSSELRGSVIIPTSEFLVRYIHQHYSIDTRKLVPVVLGIDTQYFDPANIPPQNKTVRHVPIIAMPARFTTIKGHRVLLEALHILSQHGEKFQCVLTGPTTGATSYIVSLKSRLTQLGLTGCVRIEEAPQDVRVLMCAADVVVAPSIHPEAFGCVVAEACALERCVVASDFGGFQDILRHRETGWLFPPSNASSLAETIRDVLHLSQEERIRVGRNARQRICTHFSLDRYVREIINVYSAVLKG